MDTLRIKRGKKGNLIQRKAAKGNKEEEVSKTIDSINNIILALQSKSEKGFGGKEKYKPRKKRKQG